MDNIKEIIQNPHLINARYSAYWDFLLDSYEGGVDYTDASINNQKSAGLMDRIQRLFINGVQQNINSVTSGNLFMHPKEKVDDYARRVRMSYYYNFCAPIIDIYSDHLFKQSVIEDFKEIEQTLKNPEVGNNIDLQGSSINEFRKSMSDMAQLYGHCYVIIDSPSISKTGQLNNLQEQIEKRAFPYLSLFTPQNVINWSLDEVGSPCWVLVREVYDGNEDPASFDKKNTARCIYRLWTRQEWYAFDSDGKKTDEGIHDLGVVPIVCVFDKKSKKARNFLGISSIADVAFIARDVYNASSELRQILRDQTFAFLAIQGSSDEYSALELGTGKGLIYPEGRNVPQYVSPPADNAQVYFDHIDRQITKIFEIAKMGSGGVGGKAKAAPDGGVAVDSQSGVSKAWDFNQMNSALSTKSANQEDAELRIWQIFALWLGIDKFTGNVQYPNEFSISSLQEDLSEAEQAARVQLGKTFDTEIRKTIIKKKFPRKGDEEIEVMAKEAGALMAKKEQTAGSMFADRVKGLFGKEPGDQNNTA